MSVEVARLDVVEVALEAEEAKEEVVIDGLMFGQCPRCKSDGSDYRWLNVGKDLYVVCDNCRVFWCAGSGLVSSWRRENQTIWQQNVDSLADYDIV